MCFGYAHIVHERPKGYSFLPELEACHADILSIETAQPKLDLSVLRQLPSKRFMVGVLALGDDEPIETPGVVADRLRRTLDVLPPERLLVVPDCGMKYLRREVAFAKLTAMVKGTQIVRQELAR